MRSIGPVEGAPLRAMARSETVRRTGLCVCENGAVMLGAGGRRKEGVQVRGQEMSQYL